MKSILSGDPSKITQALAPQISAEKKSVQQDQKSNAEMGTRSGGTAASTAASADKVHSDITSLVGQLTGNAASGLTSAGEGLLGTGTSATQATFGDAKTMQEQKAAQWNDIFKSAASVAGGVVGGLPAAAGSWQDSVSNALGSA